MEGFKSYFGKSGIIEVNLIVFIKNAFIYYTVGHVRKFVLNLTCHE